MRRLCCALVDGCGGEATVAVVHQGLEDHRWQGAAVTLLGGVERLIEMFTLLRPAGSLIQAQVVVCQGRQGQANQQQGKQNAHRELLGKLSWSAAGVAAGYFRWLVEACRVTTCH